MNDEVNISPHGCDMNGTPYFVWTPRKGCSNSG